MADYKLWNALKNAKKYRWVELSHSLNNESPCPASRKALWSWQRPCGTGASRNWNA